MKSQPGPSEVVLVMIGNTHIIKGAAGGPLAAEFAPEVTFEVRPHAVRDERRLVIQRLEQLKVRLVADWMRKTRNPETYAVIRWAASEAVSLAWLSGMPLLTLPALLDEKVAEALHRHARQKFIRTRSEQLFLAA